MLCFVVHTSVQENKTERNQKQTASNSVQVTQDIWTYNLKLYNIREQMKINLKIFDKKRNKSQDMTYYFTANAFCQKFLHWIKFKEHNYKIYASRSTIFYQLQIKNLQRTPPTTKLDLCILA